MCAAQSPDPFPRLLFPDGREEHARGVSDAAWSDLALEQVFDRVFHNLVPVDTVRAAVREPLVSIDQIRYRQDVFRDLLRSDVSGAVRTFADAIDSSRTTARLASTSHYAVNSDRLHLSAVSEYVHAVQDGAAQLGGLVAAGRATSHAMKRASGALHELCNDGSFTALADDVDALTAAVDGVQAEVCIRGARFSITAPRREDDLATAAAEVFARFRRLSTPDSPSMEIPRPTMDHVQEWVLDAVAKLRPDLFGQLRVFHQNTSDFVHPGIIRLTDELVFFRGIIHHVESIARAGAEFTLPDVSESRRGFTVHGAFDVALADALPVDAELVTNDFTLTDDERLLVITGPNQGGKTTAARTVGQLHHLAAIGAPVAGTSARVFLTDQILTQFERGERLESLEGKLGEEVHAIHDLLDAATSRTLIVLNEIFTSTAVADAEVLSAEVLRRAVSTAGTVVCVTFIDSLSRLDDTTVSMVSVIDTSDPTKRTFRVERRAADGRAYARALAQKYALTSDAIIAEVTEDKLFSATSGPSVSRSSGGQS